MLDPRMMGLDEAKLKALQEVTRRIHCELEVGGNELRVRFIPEDGEAAQHVPNLVDQLARNFANTVYVYLAMKGKLVHAA